MKRGFSWIFGGVFVLSAMLMCFLPVKNSAKNETYASESIEQLYYDESTKELVSKNPTTLIGATADKTPFDEETNQRMEGVSITPNADEYGQVKTFSYNLCGGNGYTPEVDDNILMWVYLIDAITFKLEISLGNSSSKTLTWKFDAQKIYEIGSGWKLIALKLSDFRNELNSSETYSLITFKYVSETIENQGQEGYESYDVKTDERFSFYHVFTSKNANLIKKSGKIHSLSKAFYEFSENFDIGDGVFVGDKATILSPSKMFKYLYVGKNDLSDYTGSGKYYWSISIKNPSSVITQLEFGDNVYFYEKGFYYLSIQLYEEMTISDESIMNFGLNIFADEINLGSFLTGAKYKIKDDETILISLKLSQAITDVDELDISLSNNNAEIESYYEEDGVVYIFVYGKDDGKVNLEVSAEAKSKYNDEIQTFSSTATIDVDYSKNDVDIFMVIIWIVFASFCLGIIIYLSISVVKSRKNDVK